MSLFLHSSNADESAVWAAGGGVGGETHYNVGLGLTIHDHSSSAELFYMGKAIKARARAWGWGRGARPGLERLTGTRR